MATAQDSDDAIEVSSANPSETLALAARLAALARPGDVIALAGDLGTGKTTFARGFINALFAAHNLPREDVPSPTFTLVQEYPLPDFTVYHIDLYRIEKPSEIDQLGIEEGFSRDVSLIEWPDRLGDLLPANRLHLAFRQGDPDKGPEARIVRLIARGDWRQRIQNARLDG